MTSNPAEIREDNPIQKLFESQTREAERVRYLIRWAW